MDTIKQQKRAEAIHGLKRGIRAIILLAAPVLISYGIWFIYANPIDYIEKGISIIFFSITAIIIFWLETQFFD